MNDQINHYEQLKDKYPDVLLLISSGRYYEAYGEDAKIIADLLSIPITTVQGKTSVYVSGFTIQNLDQFLPQLIRAGHRVAICDRLEEPKKAVNPMVHMTSEAWQVGLDALDKGEIITITSDVYDYFLGCVPPLLQERRGFVCSEASYHNRRGEGVYFSAIFQGGTYYARQTTEAAFKSRDTFKQ